MKSIKWWTAEYRSGIPTNTTIWFCNYPILMARIVSRIGDINKKPHCVQPIKEPMITQIYIELIKKAISTLLETLTRNMELFFLHTVASIHQIRQDSDSSNAIHSLYIHLVQKESCCCEMWTQFVVENKTLYYQLWHLAKES